LYNCKKDSHQKEKKTVMQSKKTLKKKLKPPREIGLENHPNISTGMLFSSCMYVSTSKV